MQTNEDKKHRKEQVQSLSPTVLFPFTHLKKKNPPERKNSRRGIEESQA